MISEGSCDAEDCRIENTKCSLGKTKKAYQLLNGSVYQAIQWICVYIAVQFHLKTLKHSMH